MASKDSLQLPKSNDSAHDSAVKHLDSSYFEYGVMRLFMIDLLNLIKTKAVLSKQFRLSPIDIDQMPYWEYELLLQALNDLVTEENDKQKGEMSQYNDMKSRMDPSKMQPKMPSMNFRAPSFKL